MSDFKSRYDSIIEAVDEWTGFYRENPDIFAEDFLLLKLKWFQAVLLCMMNIHYYFIYIAARGQGKTWFAAVFAVTRCILYPGTKVVVVSKTIGQAAEIITKIREDLMPRSPYLREVISFISTSDANKPRVEFKGGSTIRVVTLGQSARHNRANLLIVDEFVHVPENMITSVLKKFLTAPRSPGFLNNSKYKNLTERNRQIYMSSAYYKSTSAFRKFVDYIGKSTRPDSGYYACDLPYQLSVAEGIQSREAIEDEMSESDFDETIWAMEAEGRWFGGIDGSFFELTSLANSRKLKYPMLPDELSVRIGSPNEISIVPKQKGEIRILTVDIALMTSAKYQNDATAIFILQSMPNNSSRLTTNVVYAESSEGEHTEDQALRIRKLYEMYQCDHLVIDVKGVGFGVADLLFREIVDKDTGYIYPPLSCCNNDEWAKRCTDSGAPKVIWAINGSERFNSDVAIMLREGFKSGKVNLLDTEYDCEEHLETLAGYSKLSLEEKLKFQLPYINTTLLVNEMVNLQYEDTNGLIKIKRGEGGMRKDRYSSLSYGFWVVNQLEEKLRKKSSVRDNIMSAANDFMYRAPKIK